VLSYLENFQIDSAWFIESSSNDFLRTAATLILVFRITILSSLNDKFVRIQEKTHLFASHFALR
jgi:hypothetical protein